MFWLVRESKRTWPKKYKNAEYEGVAVVSIITGTLGIEVCSKNIGSIRNPWKKIDVRITKHTGGGRERERECDHLISSKSHQILQVGKLS